uniref:Putative secreted protein n=1 Tax=Anopheles darlingi TaxID=43151 RepID=A0A2M4D6I6_ANODA
MCFWLPFAAASHHSSATVSATTTTPLRALDLIFVAILPSRFLHPLGPRPGSVEMLRVAVRRALRSRTLQSVRHSWPRY